MGREVKRVALDFDYPIDKMIWVGYHNPFRGLECEACERSGSNPEIKALSDAWYGRNGGHPWVHDITQDEVQALWDGGRLMHDFKEIPTAEQVNVWSKRGFGHDSINQWICVKQRAKRLGIDTSPCKYCNGNGYLWPSPEFAKLAEEWQQIDPPAGEGYQLWSTTTEGTPMSPVFKEPEQLAQWLVDNQVSSCGYDTEDYETWLKFIKGPGWALSMVGAAGNLVSGVAFAANR